MLAASCLFSSFLVWNEQRAGHIFYDPLLESFSPRNFSLLIGLLTNISIISAIILILNKPMSVMYFLCAGIVMICVRSITLYLLPLEPPVNIIPLKDPILELTFYKGNVLLKDLFFSGHTANIILMGLLSEKLIIKRIMVINGFVVGLLLILQHVHFSIDVFLAPFFAIMVYKLSVIIVNRSLNIENEEIKRCGNLAIELGFKAK